MTQRPGRSGGSVPGFKVNLDQDSQQSRNDDDRSPLQVPGFVYRVTVFYGIGAIFVAAIFIAWYAAHVLLLVFSGVLLAVLLHGISRRVENSLRLSPGLALGLVLLIAVVLLGLAGWLLVPRFVEQANELLKTLPASIQRLQAELERDGLLRKIVGNLFSLDQLISNASAMLTRAGVAFSGVLGAFGSLVIIIFVGVYFAAQPRLYIDGVVMLVPKKSRQRAREVLCEIGATLAQWLLGKLLSMTIVGVVIAIGLTSLDVPHGLALGVLAGLLDFIPYIGPIMAAVPAVLIASLQNPLLALYVVLLFVALQIAEGYLLLPLVERKMVSLPPALTISMQVLLGSLFGLAGVALATPLTAVIAVLIVMLYVQDVLGDPVKPPGEH